MLQEFGLDYAVAGAYLKANDDAEGLKLLARIDNRSYLVPCFIDTMLRRVLVRALCLRLKGSDKTPLARFLTKIDDYPKWLVLTREQHSATLHSDAIIGLEKREMNKLMTPYTIALK